MNVKIPNLTVFEKSHNFSKKQPRILATLGVKVYGWYKVDSHDKLYRQFKCQPQATYTDILHQTNYLHNIFVTYIFQVSIIICTIGHNMKWGYWISHDKVTL